MKNPLRLLLAGIAACLAGCGGPSVETYANLTPKLDLREYFNGESSGFGAFFDWSGKQNTRFTVDLEGKWKGNEGTLKETFTYDDGKVQVREWHITFTDDHNFTATAADIEGIAVGKQYGNTVHITYTLIVPRGDSTISLQMDDWLYRIDEKTVINRNVMRKFGIKVGELAIGFNRPRPAK
jgi:hypothetical protein